MAIPELQRPPIQRLNDASVAKRYDAYRDVDWDAPGMRIDPRDPRFCLAPDSALGATDWYRSLPTDTQAALGLDWLCQIFRYGVSFESCLSRGLLEFARRQAPDSPAHRYALHEVVEECNHSMMFLEALRRSGRETCDTPASLRLWEPGIARSGGTFPEWFFFNVLAGELFIDHDNRERLRRKEQLHPLVHRIMQIHVTEEARHVHFANLYLREHVPELPWWRAWWIRALLPLVLDWGAQLMLLPPPWIARRYTIPRDVMALAFGRGSEHARRVRAITAPICALAMLRNQSV